MGGEFIETAHLVLRPGNNARDNALFLDMLREDKEGFHDYCGFDYSEKKLLMFANYLERCGENHTYSVFLKEDNSFIGYVGIYKNPISNYEFEFYIKKSERRKGYCLEASSALIEKFRSGELITTEGQPIDERKLYAEALEVNIAANNALQRIGFKKTGVAVFFTGIEENENIQPQMLVNYELVLR